MQTSSRFNRTHNTSLKMVGLLASFFVLQGCASIEEVPAWERGYLAKTGMQWEAFAREGRLAGHVYTSKEASSGGSKAAGGGCGCN
ncbi:hypothetical protein OMB55_00002780 [gamma proteobacterium HIMB55]|nr:hypothetical protein OMB55_00002780 [gamma proteobacterium HIMB55]